MASDLRTLQFGFTGAGQVRGVFATLSLAYPGTLRVVGQFTVNRRITRDDGGTEDLGTVATVPFSFGPADFGLHPVTMQPDPANPPRQYIGRHPATDAPTGRMWTLPALLEALYSVERGQLDDMIASLYPPPPPPPPPEGSEQPAG